MIVIKLKFEKLFFLIIKLILSNYTFVKKLFQLLYLFCWGFTGSHFSLPIRLPLLLQYLGFCSSAAARCYVIAVYAAAVAFPSAFVECALIGEPCIVFNLW